MSRSIWTVILLALTLAGPSTATNFADCLATVRNSSDLISIGGVDSQGFRTNNSANVVGLTYNLCIQQCGEDNETVTLSNFVLQFLSWFLPWVPLMSLLPFGADDARDNFRTFLLMVGSPTFTGYTYALTLLNSRYLYNHIHSSLRGDATYRVLNDMQQLFIQRFEYRPNPAQRRRFIFLSLERLEWIKAADKELNKIRTPHGMISIGTAIFVGFISVLFVFILSLTETDTDFTEFLRTVDINGQSVGCLWTWLAPIAVATWLVSPIVSREHIENALLDCEEKFGPHADQPEQAIVGFVFSEDSDTLYSHQRCASPIYNYVRVFTWTKVVDEVLERISPTPHNAGSQNQLAPRLPGVGSTNAGSSSNSATQNRRISPTPHDTVAGAGPAQSQPASRSLAPPPGVGSTNATGSSSNSATQNRRISPTPHDAVARASSQNQSASRSPTPLLGDGSTNATGSSSNSVAQNSQYPPSETRTPSSNSRTQLTQDHGPINHGFDFSNVSRWTDIFTAFFMAVLLQWGATGGGIILLYLTPTRGLGCRSLTLIIYGALSTVICGLLMLSGFLTEIYGKTLSTFIKILRRTAALLACLNAFGILASNLAQFGGAYDRCACNGNYISVGAKEAYIIIDFAPDDIAQLKHGAIGGFVLSLVTSVIYGAFIWLHRRYTY